MSNGRATKTKKGTRIFRRGDILRVPFPFVEDNRRRNRPSLVVSDGAVGGDFELVWVVMITGAGHAPWPRDVEIGDRYPEFGLPIPSRIRVAKIAAISSSQASLVGTIAPDILERVMGSIGGIVSTTPPR